MPAIALIVACALWGLSFPIVKALHAEQGARLPEASSAFLAAWMQVGRFGLGALILLPLLRRMRVTRNELRQGVVIAFWGGLGMAVQADGLAYTAASTSAFLTQAYCIILPLWACIQSRKLPGMKTVVATILVFVGGGILAGVRPGQMGLGRGEIETLIGAVMFTFQILALENPRYEGNRGLPVTFIMCAAIGLMFIPISWLLAPSSAAMLVAGASLPAVLLILALTVFCSLGAYLLMNTWQPKVPATEAGLIYTTEPVFTAAYALFLPAWLGVYVGEVYPNETLTVSLMVGGALIMMANILMQWRRMPHDPSIGSP
jgi:drug/metabolite transporter (DMT)-like permease